MAAIGPSNLMAGIKPFSAAATRLRVDRSSKAVLGRSDFADRIGFDHSSFWADVPVLSCFRLSFSNRRSAGSLEPRSTHPIKHIIVPVAIAQAEAVKEARLSPFPTQHRPTRVDQGRQGAAVDVDNL